MNDGGVEETLLHSASPASYAAAHHGGRKQEAGSRNYIWSPKAEDSR